MKNRNLLLAALAWVAFVPFGRPAGADEAKIVVEHANDRRKSGKFAFMGTLKLSLQVTSDAVSDARRVLATATSATDATGQSLLGTIFPTDWRDIRRTKEKRNTGIVELTLKNPARAALMLREVTGTIELYEPARDPQSVVTIADIAAQAGRRLNDPVLQAAGLKIAYLGRAQLESFQKGLKNTTTLRAPGQLNVTEKQNLIDALNLNNSTLAIRIADPNDRLVDIKIENSDGKALRKRSSQGNAVGKLYEYEEAIPADARIKIYVATPQSIAKIPFRLTDVPLP